MTATTTFFTYYESPIGLIKIGGTETYISELLFLDNNTQIVHGEPGISDIMHVCTEQLIEYFQGKRKTFNLPIHQDGTEFQQRVWNKLMLIEYGKTISYLELAKTIGDDKLTRAVAAANAKNKIDLIIPCHRVIGTSKTLVGFNGGLWRKKWLLQHEFRIKNGIQTLF